MLNFFLIKLIVIQSVKKMAMNYFWWCATAL